MMFGSRLNLFNVLNYSTVKKAFFNACSCKCKDYSGREATFLKKLLVTKRSKKKFYQDDRPSKSVQTFINDPASRRRAPMRVSVLNKLFMTHITDILATGEVSPDLVGRGMEVTNVSVNNDYQFIKVFWVAKSQEDEAWLERSLPGISISLRHELSQLHLMGSVPKIHFILDTKNSQLASLDALLASCDKGTDSDLIVAENASDDDIPQMVNNIYGLQYDNVVSKLMVSLNKAKAPHRKNYLDNGTKVSSESVDFSSKYSQKESIRKFLLQKKLNKENYKKIQGSIHTQDVIEYSYDEFDDHEEYNEEKHNK